MTETIIITPYGNEYPFDLLVNMMDDDVREILNLTLAPCDEQEFADIYSGGHEAKFGETWEPYKACPQL